MSKIESALKMFWRAICLGVKVDYVLMDSWFTCETFVSEEVQTTEAALQRCSD